MIPDLGKYADTVLSAYAISLGLLFGTVILSVWQSKRMKTRLAEAEARFQKSGETGADQPQPNTNPTD